MIESAWLRTGPDLRQPGHLGVDVEEAGDAAGRRGVEHDGVVRPPAGAAAPDRLVRLAGSSTSRSPGATVVAKSMAPIFLSDPAGAAQVVEHVEVLEQRLLGVDGEREDLAAVGRDGDPALLVGQRRGVEQLRDALPALDLEEQHAAAARRPAPARARRPPSSCRCRPCR